MEEERLVTSTKTEEEFDVEIPDEEADEISTVGDAVNYINAKC